MGREEYQMVMTVIVIVLIGFVLLSEAIESAATWTKWIAHLTRRVTATLALLALIIIAFSVIIGPEKAAAGAGSFADGLRQIVDAVRH